MFSKLTVNCRSLSTNLDKIDYSLKSLNVNFDCICITKIWIKAVESTDSYNMTDYTFLSKPRMEKRGGGVGMYIANRLKFKERNDLNTNSGNCPYESLFVEVKLEKNKVIGVIYESKRENVCTIVCTSYDAFLEILNTQMNECLSWKQFKQMVHERNINIL